MINRGPHTEYFSPLGLPLVPSATTGPTRAAIVVYRAYRADPLFAPEPTFFELRLVLEYCAYYMAAPCWQAHAEEVRALQRSIELVTNVDELGGWLYACKQIGIEPV